MNEQIKPTGELTAGRASSTLDRGRFHQNVYFAMDQGQNENPPKGQKPLKAEGSHRADGSELDKLWKDRSKQSFTQGEMEVRRILEEMAQQQQGISPHSEEKPSSAAYSNSNYKYDAYNEIDLEDPGARGVATEERPEADAPRGNNRQHERAQNEVRERGRGRGRERRGANPEEFNIFPPKITQPILTTWLDDFNSIDGTQPSERLTPEMYHKVEELRRLVDPNPDDPIFENERQSILDEAEKQLQKISARGERLGLYLLDDDRQKLMTEPLKWLDSKFNLIYGAAESGQELDSQVMSSVQSLVGEATQFLTRRYEKAFEAGDIAERDRYKNFIDLFNRQFSTTVNALLARTTVDSRNIEQIVGVYGRLRTQGLLGALSFDEGRVGAMYNRMDEYLETIRLAEGGEGKFHLTADMVSTLQQRIEDEQFELAKKGVGVFADSYKKVLLNAQKEGRKDADDVLKAQILSSVRLAYNIHVSSQRQALLSARGNHLAGVDAYYSDPGGAFNFFNIEDFTIEKFGILNQEQLKYMRYVQMDLALHEKLDDPTEAGKLTRAQLEMRGRRLFRDLSAAPDFYSSGWRIKGILQQIEQVTRYKMENEIIVKDLLTTDSYPEVKARFGEYLEARKKSAEWQIHATSPEGEAKARQKIAWEFVRGVQPYDAGGVYIPPGLTKQERDIYKLAFKSTFQSKEFNRKVKDKSANLGLFLRLTNKDVSTEVLRDGYEKDDPWAPKKETKEIIWERIREYRPEEIMRLVRERMDPKDVNDAAYLKKFKEVFSEVGESYDKFRMDYGAVIRSLREEAMSDGAGRQINMMKMTSEQIETIDKALGSGAAGRIQRTYKKIDEFIARKDSEGKNLIDRLSKSWRYEDVYKRTLNVDDAILNELEYTPQNSGITRLSQFFTNEKGADALQRNGNDLGHNAKSASAQISGVMEESDEGKLKAAKEQHKETAAYSGPQTTARGFRYSYGSNMRFSLQDHWADILNIGKLPFRWSSSELERVFGPGQVPLTSEQARGKLDELRGFLTGRNDKNPHEAEKYYLELEYALRADVGARFRDKSFGIGFYIMLALLLVPLAASAKVVSEASK